MDNTDSEPEQNQEQNQDSEFTYDIRIPQERVAVLIGKEGETKKKIEEQAKCKLNITPDGEVIISGNDGMQLYITRDVVRAIGRGFNPKIALLLLKMDYALEVIDITMITGKSKNDLERIKGRLIGKAGKSREEVERLTDTYISIYGKTVSIIGEMDQVVIARQGISRLLEGAMHTSVFKFLEKKKKEQLFG